MFRFKKYLKYIGGCCLALCAASCQEKDLTPEAQEEIPEGMQKISFLIPDYNGGAARFGTRAYNTEEEGYMSNLYVVAVKYPDDYDPSSPESPERQVYTFALNPVGEEFKVGEIPYHQFNVTLFPGKYKFGLIANADLYLQRAKKIYEFTEEEDFENIVLNFRESTPLTPTHLPMVCLPKNIEYSEYDDERKGYPPSQPVKEDEGYLINITAEKSVQIFAEMTFLCAKVRYTILFDKTDGGISEAFGSGWIRFNVDEQSRPSAHNIRRQTLLAPDLYHFRDNENNITDGGVYDPAEGFIYHNNNEEDQSGAWAVSIDRYWWSDASHGGEGASYPLKPSSKLTLWEGTTADWILKEQKVWQGIVYLPENLLEDKITPGENESEQVTEIRRTYLEFPYHTRLNSNVETPEVESPTPKRIYLFGNDNEDHYTTENGAYSKLEQLTYKGLERNFFYDVVAKVVNPDGNMDIQVFVNIIPWHEVDQNVGESHLGPRPQDPGGIVSGSVNDWGVEDIDAPW